MNLGAATLLAVIWAEDVAVEDILVAEAEAVAVAGQEDEARLAVDTN